MLRQKVDCVLGVTSVVFAIPLIAVVIGLHLIFGRQPSHLDWDDTYEFSSRW